MFAIDSETLGVDHHHGAKPFFITICDDQGKLSFWEWMVNPFNREPIIPKADIEEIKQLLKTCANWAKFDEETRERHAVITQNGKFDSHTLDTIGIHDFPFAMNHDTLTIAHLLGSNQPKDLTSLASTWLGHNIQPIEDRMKIAITECRRKVQQARLKNKRLSIKGFKDEFLMKENPLGFWAIAEEGQISMPSAKGSSNKKPEEQVWKYDCWLPRAMALQQNYPEDHHYWSVTREYANTDSCVTMLLWSVLKAECIRQGLWPIYMEMRKLNGIIKDMEDASVTFNKSRACELREEYEESCVKSESICVSLSEGKLEKLPKGSSSKALREVVFDVLKLKSTRFTDAGNDSMDKYQLEEWVQTLPPSSKSKLFITHLQRFRKRMTALGYIDAYERFAIDTTEKDWARLYSSVNATGSDTLRMSCQNPNLQQVSKQEIKGEDDEKQGKNARYMFGPMPNREWWCLDYENLELKIPGYESGEQAMIDLFEKPNEPPFYGSYHLLNASIVYPDLFESLANEKGGFKTRYGATWYQWIKNAGFAVVYGCQEVKFDQTAHKKGGYRELRKRLPALFRLSDYWLNYANKHGYIETLPDKTLDCKRGYPLLTSRTEWGKVSPTVPLNYHVQSTAMWCTRKAMIRCEEQLKTWQKEGFDGKMIMQIHDELVFDFPFAADKGNLPKARRLQELMALSGNDIGIPLTVAASYCLNNWGEGVPV